MKKILITGAGGFIGSHLTELCVARGLDVRAFLHYNSNNHWGWLEESTAKKQIEVVTGDIRDYDSVFSAMRGCDTVLHLAALIGIPYSYVSPLAYIRTNVEGTYNIVQAARERGAENVVVTSTSETYGSAQYVPIDEKHPAVGQSPYAATKIGADQIALSFHKSFNLPVKVIRPFNTYGPRQSARAIIPTIMSQILAGARSLKLGSLAPTRDLTFVKDTAAAFLKVAETPQLIGEAVNVGMNQEISVGDLAQKIANILGAQIEIEEDPQRVRVKGSEVERLWCNPAKLKTLSGWSPAYNLESGLSETAQWMRENIHRFKPHLYNV